MTTPNDSVVAPLFAALLSSRPELDAARLYAHHRRLCATTTPHGADGPSTSNIAVAMALLAGDRELAALGVERSERERSLEAALTEPLAEPTRAGTRAGLDAADDPFLTMVDVARERERSAFGPAFTFLHPVDRDDEFVSEVRRCLFHDVLTAHDAGHLTRILCRFDANWIDAVDPARDGFTVDRATTIADGGPSCPFRFRRVSGAQE